MVVKGASQLNFLWFAKTPEEAEPFRLKMQGCWKAQVFPELWAAPLSLEAWCNAAFSASKGTLSTDEGFDSEPPDII